jgi:hypothetical protein
VLIGAVLLPAVWTSTASASASINVAVGVASVTYTQPFPSLGAPCAPASLTLSGSSVDVGGYTWRVTISGSGDSYCEGALSGGGALTLTASGIDSAGNTVSCVNLSGSYSRTGTDVESIAGGTCAVGNIAEAVSFVFHGELVSTNPGADVTTPITGATFVGPFVISPV